MQIISSHTLFSRMLQLTLENAGYKHIAIVQKPHRTHDGLIKDAIVDIDFYSEGEFGERCITYSQSDPSADLIRPFLTADFLVKVAEVFGQPQSAGLPSYPEYTLSDDTLMELSSSDRTAPKKQSADADLIVEGGIVTLYGISVELSPAELRMLELLYQNRGQAVSTDALAVAGFGKEQKTNVVSVYINYLRKKLEDGSGRQFIKTVRGKGYILL